MSTLINDLQAEVARQDYNHPAGYPATRDGIRLGIASLEDEVREVWEEWNLHKHDDVWKPDHIIEELKQVAAIAIRMMRELAWKGLYSDGPAPDIAAGSANGTTVKNGTTQE